MLWFYSVFTPNNHNIGVQLGLALRPDSSTVSRPFIKFPYNRFFTILYVAYIYHPVANRRQTTRFSGFYGAAERKKSALRSTYASG